MNPNDEIQEEDRIAALLGATDKDAAPPDQEALARLRAQSTEAFAASSIKPSSTPERNRRMVFNMTRWVAAAAAIIVGAGVYFWLAPATNNNALGATLGQVLENSDQADSLHLRFQRDGSKMEFWHTRKPERSRWDDLAGHYHIADGAKYWVVNEDGNEARRANPPAGSNQPLHQFLDGLGLLAVKAKLLETTPLEKRRVGDADLLVYRAALPMNKGDVFLEALVFVDSQRLHSLQARIEQAGRVLLKAELTVLAYDEPIAADKFAIADTLTEDGRIGKVTDVQGIVTLKPVLAQRWTPVRQNLVLRPGDWVRTDARGANAVALKLVKQVGVIIGPKTLVELIGPTKIKVIEGEIEVTASADATLEVLGPDDKKTVVNNKQFFHVAKAQKSIVERVERVDREPAWLLGFKGATTNESLGSLVALVDGRNVPLSVGYHKVTVDIRDQIARTVIEESFVNHTDAQLEGVFYFPLPQDASISGFGMWIGDKLIEADIVEKQRAREIYETILRERRDPGLLEWTGGNIFKARVFPIFAHAEKRIKITYTQVLPLKGSRYRYGYALQSELLQQHPLRELAIDVKVNSVVPLKSVTSPTHPTRNDQTQHSAHVEFTAQEFTPNRDFEVVVELEKGQADVVMIPHRRGEDGYFMLQLTPPAAHGDWDRPLLPDGEPLQLLILADTSASIDAGQRANQATFIGALLASLSPKDTFNLGACDVQCKWAFAQPAAADSKNEALARAFLEKRTSLGWTNLDGAVAAALKQCGPKTHVIYVGDGIVTTGDADPVAFTKRLRRIYEGKTATFHAVTLGSSYESGVLKALAALGGGSMRKITGEQGPQAVALELLGEIAQPALRDIKVEFKGIKVARLYPEALANVPAGSQQILLGRYLPEGKDQSGEVIVTGMQGDKPVRFSTRAFLKDAEQGNSFIPRLWARMHLDSLLDQGSSAAIKDEIIALSEEYQIITPYTSLLVLETDADRERFAVKRRFQMRDGERFFADGRDNAVFDLTQKQMKLAGSWRTALRRSVLSDLARLGRDARMFQPAYPRNYKGLSSLSVLGDRLLEEPGDMEFFLRRERLELKLGEMSDGLEVLDEAETAGLARKEEAQAIGYEQIGNEFKLSPVNAPAPSLPPLLAGQWNEGRGDGESFGWTGFSTVVDKDEYFDSSLMSSIEERIEFQSDGRFSLLSAATASPPIWGFGFARDMYGRGGRSYGEWLNTLFPPLPASPRREKETKSTWPIEAHDLAKSLLRTEQLAKLTGGLAVTHVAESFDPRWGDLTARSRRLELVSAKSWLTRAETDGGQTLVTWCDGKEVGIFSKEFQLGRLRAATPLDVQPPPLELSDYSMTSLEKSYAGYTPTLKPQGKDRTLLVLKHDTADYETRVLIDTARHVILSIDNSYQGKVTGATKFDDFVEAGGCWWARRVETTDADGKRVTLSTLTIRTPALADLEKQVQAELAGRAQVQLLHLPLPSVLQAKKNLAANKATFDDQFVLLMHFHLSQQWPRVLDHVKQAETLAGDKPGLRWLRSALLFDSRRHEELRQRYQEDAARLVKMGNYFLADYVVIQALSVLQANEMLTLLDVVKPLYDLQPTHVGAGNHWLSWRANYLDQVGRADEALSLRKQLATDYPHDYSLQRQYAQALGNTGDYPAAYAWLARVLVKESKWLGHEEESLRNTYAQFLRQQGRYGDLTKYLLDWVQENPAGRTAYEQYLSALIKSDQFNKADALARQWLAEGQVPDKLTPAALGRVEAAIYLMLGDGYQLYLNHVEEPWLAPLSQAALFFARGENQAGHASTIITNYKFQRTEEAAKLRKALAGILSGEIEKMPAKEVQRFVGWLNSEDADVVAWKKIADVLRTRWAGEAKDQTKNTLGQILVTVLTSHGEPGAALAFLRLQWEKGPEKYRTQYANQLFDKLLEQPWSADLEAEAFALLDKLSSDDDKGRQLLLFVAALHRLDDKLLETRFSASMKTLEHPEKLTRTELQKKKDEFQRLAREGLADRLRQDAGKQPKGRAQWLVAESLYLDTLLERDLKRVAGEAWEYVGAAPAKAAPEPTIEDALDSMLRQRYLVTLMNLAARKGAEPALIDRLLKHFDAAITAQPDAGRWKLGKYQLLVALDRTKELEQSLRQWTRQDDADSRWRIGLGYLLAEQGNVAEAITQFEAVEAADELTPSHYRALADWYLVRGQRAAHERAALAVYQTTPEYALSQAVAVRLRPWQRSDGHLPTELDKEVLRIFAVLFDKSNSPQSYLYQLQAFYSACHDFRLLAVLPDAVVGHTAARVYPFIQNMQSVLSEVRDEATADELVKRIGEVRLRAKSTVDQRALDLLEVQVERRAAEVQNQAGPHVQKALAALQRAFKREWSPGEPRLMADFLAGLGRITSAALAEEQLSQLKSLHADAASGSPDRLHMAHRRATTLHAYERGTEAIDLLQVALDEFQAAHAGVLPVSGQDALATYIAYLEGAGHFARGEKALAARLERPFHMQQRRWLIERLDQLYHHALQNGGEVSLGKGLLLYRALDKKIQKDLADADENHRYQLLTLSCQVFRTAHDKKLAGVITDLQRFAFDFVPPLLKQQNNQYASIVGTVAHTLHDIAGPRDGIDFLLRQIEVEPFWLRYNNQDGWSSSATALADWRREAKGLGAVEGRLLKLVLKELRRDLETRAQRHRVMYSQQNDSARFWKEKVADFAKTAEAVLSERSQSGAAVQYIADYFFWGLGQRKRAIEVMFVAHNQKLLDEAGQARLVDYLHRENRYGESIALLQPLIESRPENLDYRLRLMDAYFRTDRKTELLSLLKQTDAFFHEKNRWNENVLSRLAQNTLHNQLFEQAVAYYKELIPLHESTHPGRGIGNGTLSTYYTSLALAYDGLHKTPEAVEAAAGAIVAWGPRNDNRAQALTNLKQVLLRATDLDAYVLNLDKQKQDSAIVRKALGQAYRDKGEHAKAIKQLKAAAALQPNDAEISQLLVASYDKLGDKAGALEQQLQATQQSRRDLKIYEDLGRRYAALSQPAEAERAYTSIVEMQPTEAESHSLLAEIREKQNRWPEAIEQWEQAARLRALEPTGLLKLAAAQIHEKRWDNATETLRKLETQNWPSRFGDVRGQVRALERKVTKEPNQ
jgi:predicted Zn-dependent protease